MRSHLPVVIVLDDQLHLAPGVVVADWGVRSDDVRALWRDVLGEDARGGD